MSDQEQQPMTLSPEMAALMERMVAAAVKASRAPNPKEARELEADIEREKRRTLLAIELAKSEQAILERKKNGCSHSRYENGSKNAGMPAPKGTGEWTTGGQLIGRDEAFLVCMRCSYGWKWKTSYEEREQIANTGMLGMAPPKPERLVWEG
jgi:hypothetical protein